MKAVNATYTNDWNSRKYLAEYFADITYDEQCCLEFLVESLRRVPSSSVALDFGSGPVVSHLLALTDKVKEIHVSEYLESNLAEIKSWLTEEANAYDWQQFTLKILRLEGQPDPTKEDIQAREQATRQKISQLLSGDMTQPNPLGIEKREFYPLVTSHYCTEAISLNKGNWYEYMSNVMSTVKEGGTFITSICGGAVATSYQVEDLYFPLTKLEANDVLNCFCKNGFVDLDIRVRQMPEREYKLGYSYLIFACGVKSLS